MVVIQLAILGLTAFELLFEARARYLYTFSPLFIILAVCGLRKSNLNFQAYFVIEKDWRLDNELNPIHSNPLLQRAGGFT